MKHKFIKISLLMYVCFLIGGLILAGQPVQAEDTYEGEFTAQACPCLPETSTGTRYIRMQVDIPGITDSCIYNDKIMIGGKIETVGKNCFYIKSDLPDLIKKLYKFSIGIIAVLAFIMITVGGFKWILAAGNAGTVADAKSTITAAVSGLVLAMLSYLILQTVNPNLTSLQMNMPQPTLGQNLASQWCWTIPKTINGNEVIFYQQGHWGESAYQDTKGDKGFVLECGASFEYGYVDSKGNKNKLDTCNGDYCADENLMCTVESSFGRCVNVEKFCEDYDKDSCEELNLTLNTINKVVLDHSCIKRNDAWYKFLGIGGADNCVWGQKIFCPESLKRASCFEGPQGECWVMKDGKTVPYYAHESSGNIGYCTDSKYANKNANYICCKDEADPLNPKYKRYSGSTAYKLDCGAAKIGKCEDYKSIETCSDNICDLFDKCEWDTSTKACKIKK